MNALRNLLKSEKLSLPQYFEEAYKLFNEMIRNDNKDMIIIMVLSLISVLFNKIQSVGFIGTLVSFATLIRIWIFYRKVVFKIEGKKYEAGDTAIVKSFILLGIAILAGFLLALLLLPYIGGIVGMALYSRRGIGVLAAIIIPIVILIAVFIVVTLFILYFIPAYMSRRGSIGETFKYNLFLCQGNRLRMFLPLVILAVIGLLIGIILGFLGTIGTIIGALISSVINIFQVIIISIIYLNVEYNTEIPSEFYFARENYKNEANKAADESKGIEYISSLEEKKDDENN
ncbi:hypothetical protein JCM16776_0207 [Leptotrichia shahii]|uniref:Glycerophosphoryl diester phosphodiesterase membrane domain-containing protein n=1 Tax=Leptotrichia shahii TaxID=157691 RepID=A0A510JL58_9FUSO|nr:hypothetical protein [Leptotrichia shahii]BBM40004.1 hypothetical protein JCM16776_0207 [Leptotrichia shahii]